jgi:hypothetical protein
MHTCIDCGQACYCGGDIDDCEIESGADQCTCCAGEDEDDCEFEDSLQANEKREATEG